MNKDVKLIKRYQWGALEPKKYYYYHFPTVITLHDTHRLLNRLNFRFQKRFHGKKTVREMQLEDMRNGLIDIGYHYIIDYDGYVYEGRPIDVEGCHVKGKNKGNIGIVLVGNFDVENPTREQIDALLKVIEYIHSVFNYMKIPECITYHKTTSNDGFYCCGKLIHTIIKYIKKKVVLNNDVP